MAKAKEPTKIEIQSTEEVTELKANCFIVFYHDGHKRQLDTRFTGGKDANYYTSIEEASKRVRDFEGQGKEAKVYTAVL